jgi:hypothetical protein
MPFFLFTKISFHHTPKQNLFNIISSVRRVLGRNGYTQGSIHPVANSEARKTNSVAFSPQANYTD